MAFSLPLSSSSLLSSSGKKKESKKRTNSKKTPTAVITATTQKKQVRFQLPADATTTTGPHRVESKGRQQQGCGTKGRPSKRRTAKKDPHQHNNNTWHTAKELKSFRTDIELTIKWMITKGISIDDRVRGDHSSSSSLPSPNRKKKVDETAMMSMYLRMLYLEHYQHYPFCAQGVECRTPLGQLLKKKRRKEALRSVLTLQQQQQKEQRNNKEHSTQTTKINDDDDIDDRNAKALAKIYALYSKESCSLSLDRGRRNDSSTDKDVTRSSSFLLSGTKEEEQEQQWQKKKKKRQGKKKKMLLRSSIHPL